MCKLAAPGAPQDSDDPDDYTVSVDESSASLANHPTADAQFPEIIPPNARSAGISSSKFILDDASDDQIQVSLDSEAKEIGSVISAHGYRCQITDIHASKQAETSNADNLVSDDAVDSLNDVQVPAKGHPFKLNLGKIIRLGSITCKILGKIQESLPVSPTAVTRRTAATVRGIQRNLRIKVTPKPTGKAMGRCICDKARRFVSTSQYHMSHMVRVLSLEYRVDAGSNVKVRSLKLFLKSTISRRVSQNLSFAIDCQTHEQATLVLCQF